MHTGSCLMSMYLDVMCGFGIETGNRERDVMCHVSCVVIGILKFTRVFRGRQHGKKVGKKEEVSSSKVRVEERKELRKLACKRASSRIADD